MTDQFWPFGHRAKWDQEMTADHLDALGYRLATERPDGGVVVVPAGEVKPRHVNDLLEGMEWAVVILTSDERSRFEWWRMRRRLDERVRWWISTPHPVRHEEFTGRTFGEGYPSDTLALLAPHREAQDAKPLDVFFAGQNTHRRRADCLAAARRLEGMAVRVVETDGFLQGLDRADYLADMASAKVALCPAGAATPDSFRVYEALAAGCVPIVDATTSDPDYPASGYWPRAFGGTPFPIIGDWSDLDKYVRAILEDWERMAARCQGWWLQRLADERRWIADDVAAVR